MRDRKNTQTRFRWLSVSAAVLPGLVFALLTITGTLPDARSTYWVALGLIAVTGIWIGVTVADRQLLHGFAAGFLAGLVAMETQALFLGTNFANNPQYANLDMPFGWPPRVVTAVLGPLNAILAGAIAAVIAWLIGCWAKRILTD